MQRPDKEKRFQIVECAGKLFGSRPFHKVTLDDIAAEAGVGKGTLYVYFSSKEELFLSIICEGFGRIVEQLKKRLGGNNITPIEGLKYIVADLFQFAFAHPEYFELMRTNPALTYKKDPRWWEMYSALTCLINDMISAGVKTGQFVDSHPELTAVFIPGLVRSLMFLGPTDLDQKTAVEHVTAFICRGLGAGDRVDAAPVTNSISIP